MLLDFLQSSLQLASILIHLTTMVSTPQISFNFSSYNILQENLNSFELIYCGQFVISMLVRLLVYYWYANEIIYEVGGSCVYCLVVY